MTTHLILDVLIVAFIAVYAAIGFIRGVQREVFVTAALLGGWALAGAWTTRWQHDLADLIKVSSTTAGFIVTALLVCGSVLVLGWGAGTAIGSYASGAGQRLAGAALAAVNAGLFASYAVRTYTTYISTLSGRQAISDTRIVRLARDDYGDFLAVGMGVALVLTVLALAFGRTVSRRAISYGRTYPSPASREPVADPEEYKVEPARRPSRPALESTMPIAVVDSRANDGGRRVGTRFQPQSREWSHTFDSQATAPVPFPGNADATSAAALTCKSCGEPVTSADVYCPHCGKLTR